jgi:hypothetical protein
MWRRVRVPHCTGTTPKLNNGLEHRRVLPSTTGIPVWVASKNTKGRGVLIVYVQSEKDRQTLFNHWNNRLLFRDGQLVVATNEEGKARLAAIRDTPPKDPKKNPKRCVTFEMPKKKLE